MSLGSSEPNIPQSNAGDLPTSRDSVAADLNEKASPNSSREKPRSESALSDQGQSDPPAIGGAVLPNGGAVLPKIIPFETLARCGEEIWIENSGQIYRLRRTKQGKLILTK